MPQRQNQSSGNKPPIARSIYMPINGSYDEACQQSGQLSQHWQSLLESLNSLGVDNLNKRQSKTQRILRDDGATYKAYDESQEHTWGLDPIPFLLDNNTWQPIEEGLLQRTALFDLLLKDIYGPQQLLRQGVIPPETIFANSGFLRPCFGSGAIAEHGLLLHASDMIRTADNRVCVIGDRSQSPSGAGYALENRTVMTRVFPSLFRDTQVCRLAAFFQTIRHKLNQLSPNHELPNIVVLTPGSRSESYFEHAYLANYLGYSLVQGRDLTVRNGRVWTKSLGGLTRVDVILRRVDDFFCDPAELKSDSYLGVPGLLEVVRSKKVAIANPIGSGVLESPVFLKYIDDISRFFTGKALSLPTAKTYWAYDPEDLAFIVDNIPQLVIKPAFKNWNAASISGNSLSANEIDELREKIQLSPLKYVAQEFISPSHAPSWQQNNFIPRPVVLRSFAAAGEAAYHVMPGGLTYTSNTANTHVINHQMSGLSKDTWVLTTEPEKHVSLWSDQGDSVPVDQEQLFSLPSRVIENMFWLGRYMVRAESALRLLRTVFVQLNNAQPLSTIGHKTLLTAVTQVTETFPGFTHPDSLLLNNPEAELISIILDGKRAGSVMSSLNEMLECAEEVKPLMSADTQRVINDIRDEVSVLGDAFSNDFSSAPEEALDPLVTSLLAFSGLVHESMIRGYGWRFIEIGRNLERSYQTMSLIRALLVSSKKEFDEDVLLETVLLTLETLITYRRRYRARTSVMNGLELTMVDDSNPRSLHYLLKKLKDHVDELPLSNTGATLTAEKRAIVMVLYKIQLSDLSELTIVSDNDQRENLGNLLEEAKNLLNDLAGALSNRYFDHKEVYQPVQTEKWADEL
ncbi:MAG: putative circularly permuted ATP-grasp superfamily protein [Candidatus Endobugula sp.]|jgi:uncharacterized circularly permuted ATP-grasp superfamily protein/uncharacterized alpha-E superfamily protein